MAKGKITQYDVGSFSPSAVGVPGQDRSGQIIGAGIESIGKALAAREDTSNTLSAMDKFGGFELQYAQQKMDLQAKYRENPAGYATAVKDMSDKLVDGMSKGMPGGVFAKFKNLTTNAVAQDMDNNVKWAFNRDNEIQVGKITSIKQNIALKASTVSSAEGLAGVLADFTAVSPEARKFITADADEKLTKTYADLAKKNAMYAQIYARPMGVYRDLEGGAYKGILTPEEISEYTGKARTALYNRAEDEQYRTMFMAQGKLLDMQDGIDSGSVTISDLVNEREAAYANKDKKDINGKPIISPDYIKGLDNLMDTVMYSRLRLPANKETQKEVLKKFDTDWDAYLQEKKTSGKGPSEEDISKELGMYASLSSLYRDGTITKADFDEKTSIMRTKLALRQGQIPKVKSFNEVVDQAGTVPNFWWRKPGNDVVSLGYQLIKDHVDKAYSESTNDERQNLKAQMLSQYHQNVQSTPEEMMKGLKTENERKNFAQRLIFGGVNTKGERTPGVAVANSSYYDPSTARQYRPGDAMTRFGASKIFKGMNPDTGRPIWEIDPSSIDKTITIGNRNFKVKGLRHNGDFDLKEIKNE